MEVCASSREGEEGVRLKIFREEILKVHLKSLKYTFSNGRKNFKKPTEREIISNYEEIQLQIFIQKGFFTANALYFWNGKYHCTFLFENMIPRINAKNLTLAQTHGFENLGQSPKIIAPNRSISMLQPG